MSVAPWRIHFLRKVGDQRVPYVLVLDAETREEISFGPDLEAMHRARKLPAKALTTDAMGNILEVQEDGTRILHGRTPRGDKIAVFFDLKTPCNFPGCEELRQRYQDELAVLREDPNCSDCAESALIHKYQMQIAPIIDSQVPA